MKGARKQANEAKTMDLSITEDGMQPLSLRMKSASYTGKLIITTNELSVICIINWLELNSKFKSIIILLIPPTRPTRFSNATVANMVNMIEEPPNSMISCSYLFWTSSVTTLLVMTKFVCDSPNCFFMVSMKPKRYEVVLWMNLILCKFHQPFAVDPQIKYSHKLKPYVARNAYANGRTHMLESCKNMK